MTTQRQQTTDRTDMARLEIGVTSWEDVQRGMVFGGGRIDNSFEGVIHRKETYFKNLHYIEVVNYVIQDFSKKINRNIIKNQNYLLYLDKDRVVESFKLMSISFGIRGITIDFDEEERTFKMALGRTRR
ncbi:hypothetical protein HYW75_04605 [Candidatus Pacearchaeota archaeon]|nr:hypothetical protein [Candidatus Pacearchaeota archaeon]